MGGRRTSLSCLSCLAPDLMDLQASHLPALPLTHPLPFLPNRATSAPSKSCLAPIPASNPSPPPPHLDMAHLIEHGLHVLVCWADQDGLMSLPHA